MLELNHPHEQDDVQFAHLTLINAEQKKCSALINCNYKHEGRNKLKTAENKPLPLNSHCLILLGQLKKGLVGSDS